MLVCDPGLCELRRAKPASVFFGVTVEEVRVQVARIVGQCVTGDGSDPVHPALGHNYIGTEHLLLGLARENEGFHFPRVGLVR